jgi:hypothetical protein
VFCVVVLPVVVVQWQVSYGFAVRAHLVVFYSWRKDEAQ